MLADAGAVLSTERAKELIRFSLFFSSESEVKNPACLMTILVKNKHCTLCLLLKIAYV